MFSDFDRNRADRKDLRMTQIEPARWSPGEAETADDHFIGIALPDAVEITVNQADRLTSQDFARYIQENSVTKLHSVKETNQRYRSIRLARVILENTLARDHCIWIFAQRREWILFARAAARDVAQWVYISRGQGHGPASSITLRHKGRRNRIHR